MHDDPDILVNLTTASTDFEAQTIAQALEAHGVTAKVFANAGSTLQGAIANEIKVAVRRADLELARSVLRTIKAESVDIDWSEVDTGDRTALSEAELAELRPSRCPACAGDLAGVRPDGACPTCGANLRGRVLKARRAGARAAPTPARPAALKIAVVTGLVLVAIGIAAAYLSGPAQEFLHRLLGR